MQKMYNRITMLHEIQVSAPAKVNIGLYVSPKRNDGFHDIASIFTTVPICDDITVYRSSVDRECDVQCKYIEGFGESDFVLPKENTITATYNAFCELTGLEKGVQVVIRKKIHAGGGLGGGSSDAASFLFALEKLFEQELTSEQLWCVASKVGSDVFFFLYCLYNNVSTAFVSGRGDIVKKIASRSDFYTLVVCPNVHSSTKEAYAEIDEWYRLGKIQREKKKTESELVEMYNRPIQKWRFLNDFTPVITEKYRVVKEAIDEMKLSGALFADMSGSGSSVFGVFDTKEALKASYEKMRVAWNCYA